MNDIYVIINGIEYLIPLAVVSENKQVILNYLKLDLGKIYFDIDRFISEDNRNDVFRIYRQCVSSVGMSAMDIQDDYLDSFNKLDSLLKLYDNKMDLAFKNGNNQDGYQTMLSGLEIVLDFYRKMINEEEIEVSKKIA